MANMKQIKEISFKDRDAIFGRLERLASQANMSKEEYAQYRHEWKVYNDLFNCVDSAKEQGIEEGIKKGRAEGLKEGRAEGLAEGAQMQNLENARKLKALGVSTEIIMKATNLTIEEIEKL